MSTEAMHLELQTASVVRKHVLEQHESLRVLLRAALDATTRTLRSEPAASASLMGLVHNLRRRFRAHLSFEERHLLPLLAAVDVWGPLRVSRLLDEHACQRGELDTLLEGLETGWDAIRLAVATRSLVAELLLDMADEEAGCLSAELLRDDVVSIDQSTD